MRRFFRSLHKKNPPRSHRHPQKATNPLSSMASTPISTIVWCVWVYESPPLRPLNCGFS